MTKLTAIRCAVLIATASCCHWASAQSSPSTLKEAVERSILQNPEVKLRFHNLEAAKAERKGAEGAWLPRVDLEVAGGKYEILTPSFGSPVNYPDNRASLQLRQTLFDGFATLHEVRRLSYAQQTAYFDLLSVSNQTALEVARAYLDVLRYRDLVQLAADNFTSHQEVHDRLNQKVAAGVGRKVDLEQASGRKALAESNWLTEVSNLHDVTVRYQRLVGVLPPATLAAVDPMTEYVKPAAGYAADAVRTNPDFLSAVATLRGYRADGQSRKAAYYPTLELRARQGVETNQSGVYGSYRDSALELVLNVNLYRGGSDRARIDQYVAKLGAAYDLRDKACRDIWQTGEIAFNDSQRLSAQITLLGQHELSTSKALQAYQQQFDIGQRSLLDLLDTENELYQARRALSNAEYDLKLAAIRVLANSGTLLDNLKLRTLTPEAPSASGNAQDEDETMQCDSHVPVSPALDRTFNSRPANAAVAAATPVVPATPIPAPTPTPTPSSNTDAACSQLPKVVEAWRSAWNHKDIASYLAAYAKQFSLPKGMDRNQWEAMRKGRISKQGDITISIAKLTPLRCDAKFAEVSFLQEYASPDFKDSVNKNLSFEMIQGAWKITREAVTKGRAY